MTYANKYWSKDCTFAYNCGLLSFIDNKLRDEFVKFYTDLENIYSWGLLTKPYYNQIFVVLEQYALRCFVEKLNLSVGTLLEGVTLKKQNYSAEKLGYVHLFGVGKYLDKNMKKIHDILKSEYPDILNIINNYKTGYPEKLSFKA